MKEDVYKYNYKRRNENLNKLAARLEEIFHYDWPNRNSSSLYISSYNHKDLEPYHIVAGLLQLGPPKLVLVKEKLNSWQELGVMFSADPKGRTGYDLPEYISFRGWREINRFLDGVHTIADLKAAAESAFVIHTVLKETEEEVDA